MRGLPADAPRKQSFSTKLDIPARSSCSDIYALFIVLLLAPMSVMIFLFCLPLTLLVQAIASLFHCCCLCERPLDSVERGCGFQLFKCLACVPAVPLTVITLFWTLVVRTVRFVLCAPFAYTCFCSRTYRSLETLKPYMGRPGSYRPNGKLVSDDFAAMHGFFWNYSDLFIGVIGAMDRQGCCEFLPSLPYNIAFVPIWKFVVMCNPYLYDLEPVFTNQWTEPIDANGDMQIDSRDWKISQRNLQTAICRVLLRPENAKRIDAAEFTGFHQYPPDHRASATVAGVQFSTPNPGCFCFCGCRTTLISHTVHQYKVSSPPKSESAAWGLIGVHLQYWNPLYHLSGFVEVNMRKDGGIEHPMWLVGDPTSRFHMNGFAGINGLFERIMVDFIKYIRAQKGCIAREMDGSMV